MVFLGGGVYLGSEDRKQLRAIVSNASEHTSIWEPLRVTLGALAGPRELAQPTATEDAMPLGWRPQSGIAGLGIAEEVYLPRDLPGQGKVHCGERSQPL